MIFLPGRRLWPEIACETPADVPVPQQRVREQLAATWPAFRRWWQDGANTRPAAGEARARLQEHMPELVPTWERLTGMIPGDADAGAALALWNPPPFLTGCSQAAVLDGGPARRFACCAGYRCTCPTTSPRQTAAAGGPRCTSLRTGRPSSPAGR